MLNDYLAQKTKWIRRNEFDYLGICIESSYNRGDINMNGGEKEVL